MLQAGKTYKVKVELNSGEVGYGRVVVLSKEGSKFLIQLSTSKQSNQVLPKGTKLSFVSDSMSNPFNGVWTTQVSAARIHSGKTVMECGSPRFESLAQKRKSQRLSCNCPVSARTDAGIEIDYELIANNISKTGIGLEAQRQDVSEFQVGKQVDLIIASQAGDIAVTSRVVRSQYNWLANRTVIGLEFTQLDDTAAETLTAFLQKLGLQKPDEHQEDMRLLNSWMKSSRDNMFFIKPADPDSQQPE